MDDETIVVYTRAPSVGLLYPRPQRPAFVVNTDSRIIVVRTEPVAIFVTED